MKVNLRLNFWLTFVNEQERNEFISHFEKRIGTNDNIILDDHWTVGNIFV